MLQQAESKCSRFSTTGFRLHAHIPAFKDSRQRGGLDRGHSEVAQLIQVSQLGFRQNVQRGKSGHNILSW